MPRTSILLSILAMLAAGPCAALTLDLPAKVLSEETRRETPGSYALPLAAFDGTSVPSRQVEGTLDQRSFRLDAAGTSTLALISPLRDQLLADGFDILFECDAAACGGFDFRFNTEVMPEPDMHVDLGDYRFLSAESADEWVSVLVSRSAGAGYVQVTRVTDTPRSTPPEETIVNLDETSAPIDVEEPALQSPGMMAALDGDGSAVLDDLVFDSGSAALAEGDYPSLEAVVAWLQANPDGTVALVGHTDASGSLAANVALSEQRAETVAKVLVQKYGADAGRVDAHGVGYLAPRATNQTEEGRQKNRRVEVVVTSTR